MESIFTVIQDFEIELANTEWWRFKRAAYLQSKYLIMNTC
jgi:hypothetical protein